MIIGEGNYFVIAPKGTDKEGKDLFTPYAWQCVILEGELHYRQTPQDENNPLYFRKANLDIKSIAFMSEIVDYFEQMNKTIDSSPCYVCGRVKPDIHVIHMEKMQPVVYRAHKACARMGVTGRWTPWADSLRGY